MLPTPNDDDHHFDDLDDHAEDRVRFIVIASGALVVLVGEGWVGVYLGEEGGDDPGVGAGAGAPGFNTGFLRSFVSIAIGGAIIAGVSAALGAVS
jgi:hypothetical protein